MAISPALFNVYAEDFMKAVQKLAGQNIWHLFYADDLVISLEKKDLDPVLEAIYKCADDYKLILSCGNSCKDSTLRTDSYSGRFT